MRTATLGLCGTALALSITALTPGTGHSQVAGISYPRAGVVCDKAGPVCYDGLGPSIAWTEQYFGPAAANRLSQALQQSSNRDFRLSSGQACMVARRTCFEDGWNQRQVAVALTSQLFGSGGTPSPGGGWQPGSAGNPNNPNVSRSRGICNLNRSGQILFNGPCQLRQMSQGGKTRYRIQLQNGNTFVFEQVGRGWQIRDGFGGNWPVRFIDRGNTGLFLFADYRLTATQTNSNRPANREAALGSAISNLLNALFQ